MDASAIRTGGTAAYFVKVFLGVGVLFALGTEILSPSPFEFHVALGAMLFRGIFFGGLMATFAATTQRGSRYRGDIAGVLSCRQEASDSVAAPIEAVQHEATEALSALRVRGVRRVQATPVRLLATTRISSKSFGERIEIEISPDGRSSTRVVVRSKPIWPITFADGGKNLQNVEVIMTRFGALGDAPQRAS